LRADPELDRVGRDEEEVALPFVAKGGVAMMAVKGVAAAGLARARAQATGRRVQAISRTRDACAVIVHRDAQGVVKLSICSLRIDLGVEGCIIGIQ
jgi:hypothetical protein